MSEAQQEAEAIIKVLEAENARLRAALKPFADAGIWFERFPAAFGYTPAGYLTLTDFLNTVQFYGRHPLDVLMVKHFREARAALSQEGRE